MALAKLQRKYIFLGAGGMHARTRKTLHTYIRREKRNEESLKNNNIFAIVFLKRKKRSG